LPTPAKRYGMFITIFSTVNMIALKQKMLLS